MPTIKAQEDLIALLDSCEDLKARGYEFSILGGVLVEREGHARGVWRCSRSGFSWTPAGYNEPVHWAEDAEAAVAYTLNLFSPV